MKKICSNLVFLYLFINLSAIAQESGVGKVIVIKGEASVERAQSSPKALSQGDLLQISDLIQTKEKSFIKLRMNDETTISLGPNSKFAIYEYSVKDGLRTTKYQHVFGKLRAIVKKKAKQGEVINFGQKEVSFSVRGTTFLTNSYIVKGKEVNDFALLKGQGNLDVSKIDAKKATLDMKAGQTYNSALNKVGTIPKDVLEKMLKNADDFLPSLQTPEGVASEFAKSLAGAGIAGAALVGGIASLIPDNDDQEDKPEDKPKEELEEKKEEIAAEKKEEVKPKSSLTILPHDPLPSIKDMPEDIRYVLLRQRDDRLENRCYYWFYKRLPGVGEKERFRRRRDCDEYDNDLD